MGPYLYYYKMVFIQIIDVRQSFDSERREIDYQYASWSAGMIIFFCACFAIMTDFLCRPGAFY